jgi:hypothetical protein
MQHRVSDLAAQLRDQASAVKSQLAKEGLAHSLVERLAVALTKRSTSSLKTLASKEVTGR